MYLHVDKIISLSEVQILSSVDCETLLAVRLLKRWTNAGHKDSTFQVRYIKCSI